MRAVLVALAVVLPLAGCSSGSGDVSRPFTLAGNVWGGARTDGASALVVAFVGGPAYMPGNPCSVEYTGHVQETATSVRVTVTARSPRSTDGRGSFCTAEGYGRTARVALRSPLDHRAVLDADGKAHDVFDGSKLHHPGWIPPGLAFNAESGRETAWTQMWTSTGGARSDCVPGLASLMLVEGAASFLDTYPRNGGPSIATVDVHGATALLYGWGEDDANRLTWTNDGHGYLVEATKGCPDSKVPASTLLRFADGLQ